MFLIFLGIIQRTLPFEALPGKFMSSASRLFWPAPDYNSIRKKLKIMKDT